MVFVFVLAEKYCTLIEKENGLILLQELIQHPKPPASVKQLATIVLENCRKYKENPWCNIDCFLEG